MEKNIDLIEAIASGIIEALKDFEYAIPLGISNRHIHLCQGDLEALFGKNHQLTKMKDLAQPGQYACKEMVTICGPKGEIDKVRILGPLRKDTQIEILKGDCFKLGINAPIKSSGELLGTPGIILKTDYATQTVSKGLIIAKRHIHMTVNDAKKFEVVNGQIVSIKLEGMRGGVYSGVLIRADDNSHLECHLDTEEANAMNLNGNSRVKILTDTVIDY